MSTGLEKTNFEAIFSL